MSIFQCATIRKDITVRLDKPNTAINATQSTIGELI